MQPDLARNRAHTIARMTYWGNDGSRAERAPCEDCGETKLLEVHHHDGDPFNNARENLIGLCHACHRSEHRSREIDERLAAMEADFQTLTN